jgi:hypothetical protein
MGTAAKMRKEAYRVAVGWSRWKGCSGFITAAGRAIVTRGVINRQIQSFPLCARSLWRRASLRPQGTV